MTPAKGAKQHLVIGIEMAMAPSASSRRQNRRQHFPVNIVNPQNHLHCWRKIGGRITRK
jgi:hypothetical protein